MTVHITYFDLKGYRIKTVKDLPIGLVVPYDYIDAIIKLKSESNLPGIEGRLYHILIEIRTEAMLITKLIPYDYLEEMEKIRNMSSKDLESFIK